MRAACRITGVICSLLLTVNVQAEPPRIVTFGDSATAPRNWSGRVLGNSRWEHAKASPEVEVINKGVLGNTIALATEHFKREPNIVVI